MSKPTTTLTTKPAATAVTELTAPDPRFDNLRKMLVEEKRGLCQTVAMMLLTGIELKRLKKEHGIKRGGDRKSKDHRDPLISFEDLVHQQTGLSIGSAKRRVQLVDGAKARSKTLHDLEDKLLSTPFASLPADIQEQVNSAITKVCDGETLKSLTEDHKVLKQEKGANLAKDRNKGGNSTKAKKKSPEDEAQDHFHAFHLTALGLRSDDRSKFLRLLCYLPLDLKDGQTASDTVTLTDLRDELQAWTDELQKACKAKAESLRKAKGKTAADREHEAAASLVAALPAESNPNRS